VARAHARVARAMAHICALVSHGADAEDDSSDFGLLGSFWGSNVPQNGRSLPWTPINCSAKFDAASFRPILGGEIRNRTNKQTNKNTQTVNDISTPCLSACEDNKKLRPK